VRKVFFIKPCLSLNISNFPSARGLVKMSATYKFEDIIKDHCALLNFVYEEMVSSIDVGVTMKYWILREPDATPIVIVNNNNLQHLIG
jgi:hypothetical protein